MTLNTVAPTPLSENSGPNMDIAIRSFVAFLFVFAITRLVGRRELSTLEPFDVIMLVVIGDLVQQGVTHCRHTHPRPHRP
jgi:uncharacterized membrane protein YcaP (DUF421 family)